MNVNDLQNAQAQLADGDRSRVLWPLPSNVPGATRGTRLYDSTADLAKTGKVSYVFSCFNQDQPLDRVDFPALASRLAQNAVHEKLAAQWIEHVKTP